ncbi:MAG TPA: VTT domain-containing protein [Thermodesulfovibrionales bacterium]|nr:VTT domain-containing protein [Thermodesulfovibrionales bacterium]
MSEEMSAAKERRTSALRPALRKELETFSQKCINCELCRKECAFLKKYGKPKDIADSYNPSDRSHRAMPFECSLCRLCAAVCPVKLDPARMFLEMRREMVSSGRGDYPEHAVILGYEKKGTSPRFSFYTIPEGCDTIYFPGCTLQGTRPDKVIKVYDHLRQKVPNLGIVLDCCTKPSHDLGREDYFNAMFQEMKNYLVDKGIRNVLVACPNCYKVFKNYGGEISVGSVYEFMAQNGLPDTGQVQGTITIHDSCAVRFEEPVHAAIRDLVTAKGLTIKEMPHHGKKTLCCGEGGSVGFLAPDLAKNWGNIRKKEADGKRIITYCAGCANYLGSLTPTSHIIDLLFEPEAALSGSVRVSKAPFTYLNRLRLKNFLKKKAKGTTVRERTFAIRMEDEKGGLMSRLLLLLLIISAIFAIRYTGATRYLDQETVRGLISGYGTLAPAIYMLIYAIAPSLFLPGLPLTIAGGILFGPFWGVVYSITGATIGACIAFLVSRYIARNWVEKKLLSPKWKRLDEGVENHGWKIVAFTRLIPLFPFNLLNYAFGLTKIKFLHYAVTSFICMLPACIAYVVFSSSLLDLFKGKTSLSFLTGLGLIILVSLTPVFYRRYKDKKGQDLQL